MILSARNVMGKETLLSTREKELTQSNHDLQLLAELESRNCGKPIVESEYDIADAATVFEYYGGLANKVSGSVNPVPDNALSLSLKEPVGVAGQIIP